VSWRQNTHAARSGSNQSSKIKKAKAKISKLKIENMKIENKNKTLPTYARILDSVPAGAPRTQPMDNLKQKTEVILV